MKISFDFDGTLTEVKYFNLALGFINHGCDVYITTARHINKQNNDVFALAERLGLPKEKIRFTNFESKLPYVKNFDLHFDDDDIEIEDIKLHQGKCIGVLVNENKFNLF
jgi:hypothetical protein